jgi:predicted transcriptional regulator
LPSLAVAIGLNQALFLQQVHYWLQTSKKVHDGKKWTYNTIEEWCEQFPFFSKSTINRTVADLVDSGLLIVEKLSENKHDRTNYYTIDYVKLDKSTIGKFRN